MVKQYIQLQLQLFTIMIDIYNDDDGVSRLNRQMSLVSGVSRFCEFSCGTSGRSLLSIDAHKLHRQVELTESTVTWTDPCADDVSGWLIQNHIYNDDLANRLPAVNATTGKETQCNRTIRLISHAAKILLIVLQERIHQAVSSQLNGTCTRGEDERKMDTMKIKPLPIHRAREPEKISYQEFKIIVEH